MRKVRYSRKRVIKLLLEYGVHLWILLFIVNAVVLYTVNFFLHASTDKGPKNSSTLVQVIPSSDDSLSPAPDDSAATPSATTVPDFDSSDSTQPTPTPIGQVISVSFSLPGIGSGGAVTKPLHTSRNLTIYLYSPDANSYDSTVKPLYTIKTKVIYDANPHSPTYTSFVNPYIDLGTIKQGTYQMVLRSDQTTRQLVRSDNPNDVGGQLFSFSFLENIIPHQTMLTGDIMPYPNGDGVMDIADYNAFVNCFGDKADAPLCPNRQAADLDDNGKIDGTDYNLMVLNFKTLLSLGQPVPKLSQTPAPTIKKPISPTVSQKPSPTKSETESQASPAATASSGSGAGGIILLFFIFLLVLVGGIVVLYKVPFVTNKLQEMGIQLPPLPLLSSKQAAEEQPQTGTESSNPDQSTSETQTETTTEVQEAAPVDEQIDKTYFVKNKSKDEKGVWVVLTDDNGPIDGFYTGGDIGNGFSRIKGALKHEGDKTYVAITEVLPSE
jgi:hypothetical protein